ncbi:phosphatidylinositol 3 and 4-kinase-domain-containing protein [Mycena galopus ATCC 62051]|nr:phosphatidylinositol 3 and 4-kinase-domain-containing protein [Mycena galopus ATCC 62051]
MPPSGYQPLSSGPVDDTDEFPSTSPTTARPRGRPRRPRMGSIDLNGLDSAFRQWTLVIASRLKLQKKSSGGPSKKKIWRSVFEPVDIPILDPGFVKTLDHNPPMTQSEFDTLALSVRNAIEDGIQPKMITKGSSGSYFARAKNEMDRVHTVAVFKPKDEEPYGRLNPKTTKWLHRQLRWIIPFGRACLIPNLSYIRLYPPPAASLLDSRLQLNIVPPTQLVSLSSPAFFYDWLDRNAAKKGKPLPEKIGSMQFFLTGYQDASEFLRKYPWPGRAIADTFDDSTHRQGGVTKRMLSALKIVCGRTGEVEEDDEADYEEEHVLFDVTETSDSRPFYWSQALQQSFREELEKLVILDYLMLNTDRGADNYMIKYCDGDHEKSLVDVAPSLSSRVQMPSMSELRKPDGSSQVHPSPSMGPSASTSSLSENYTRKPHIHIAAIDNSLSFPHEHPQGWRTYTYGWLYLPVSVIGRPFSEKTRNHFLPLLTSKEWWEETTFELLKLFSVDPDFHPKMFGRQLAVMKGQAWNIVQSLQHNDEGPLELTRRSKVLDTAVPRLSISSVPLPRRTRSQSSGSDFPPPMNRRSTDASGIPRPVPFAAKFKRVHPGTKGIDVLEHLERLDAVEASLQRLGGEEEYDDEEEVDVGESSSSKPIQVPPTRHRAGSPSTSSGMATSPFSPPGSPPLPTVLEVPSATSSDAEEEDVAMLSKSMSQVHDHHQRWASGGATGHGVEWMGSGETAKRTVIVERLENVQKNPLCTCW